MTSPVSVIDSVSVDLSARNSRVFRPFFPGCVLLDVESVVFRELGCVLEERRDLVIEPTVANKRFKSGRRVARHPAMMLAPHSIVDQMATLVAFQKKSSIWVRPSTYWNRIIEQMQALAARQRMNPAEILDFLSMFEFQRTMIGSTTKTRSVRVEEVAADHYVSKAIECMVHHATSYLTGRLRTGPALLKYISFAAVARHTCRRLVHSERCSRKMLQLKIRH